MGGEITVDKWCLDPLAYALGYDIYSRLRRAFTSFSEMQTFLIEIIPDLAHVSDPTSMLETYQVLNSESQEVQLVLCKAHLAQLSHKGVSGFF